MPKKYTEEDRKNFCYRWSKSGQSKTEFCKATGICKSAFYRWLMQYDLSSNGSNQTELMRFLPVEVKSHIAHNYRVEIILPNGILLNTEISSVSLLVRELTK